jgi:NitT/TauT family transport system ATP-binding protein
MNSAAPRAVGSSGAVTGPSTALTVTGVTKIYRTQQQEQTHALATTSFDVAEGEFLSLVGPSGCGKTTLMKICAGLLAPTDGHVAFRDTGAPVEPGRYGVVFQSPALLEWRNVLDNLRLPAQVLKLDRRAATERARELLELVNLPDVADKYPNELSGGMRQRAAIARALVHDPEILFMDEPFGALDAFTRERLNEELQHIHQQSGKTVIFVTHSISEAVFLSDRVLVMSTRPGRVVSDEVIDVARPRTDESRTTAPFREYERSVREALRSGTGEATS